MIFSTGLKKIYESIKKQPKDKQKSLYNQLQEKIVSNPVLAYKFNLLEAIESNKKNFDKDSAAKYVAALKAQHSTFLKENKSVALFYKEEKKLFEYFNVNQSDVVSSKLDLIVNKKNNELNESLIIEYITDNRLMTGSDRLKSTQEAVKRQLVYAKKNGSDNILAKQFEAIERKSKKLSDKRRTMVETSLRAVKEEAFKNFGSACDKTYKLRMITEKLLMEAIPANMDKKMAKQWNNKMEQQEAVPEGKKFNMGSLSFLKNIQIEVPDLFDQESLSSINNEEEDVVEIKFNMELYPLLVKMSQLKAIDSGMPALEKKLNGLKRTFMNKFIYQKNITVLDPIDSIWIVDESDFPENFYPEERAGEKGYYIIAPHFTIVIQTGKNVPPEKYRDITYEVLKEFNDYLPNIEFLSNILTPDAQKELFITTPKGRSTEYGDRTGPNKYYNDSHEGENGLDAIIGGTVKDSEGKEFSMEPYSKGKGKGNNDDFDFNLDDEDTADKAAQAAAKNASRQKPQA